MLSSLVYKESAHFIGQAANNTYYDFEYTEKGDYIQREIEFLSGNTFILLSFIISCWISLFSVVAMYIFIWRIHKVFVNMYHKYLESNRKFSKFKKEIEDQNDETRVFITFSQNSIIVFKILRLGLFSSKIEEKVFNNDDKNENETSKMLRKKKQAFISFFKAPELYIDHIRRTYSNSFRIFLNQIYESQSHFPEYKLASNQYYMDISTRIDLLKNRFLEFWTKEGLLPIQIDEEVNLLKEFNLEIELKSDSLTDAYCNIRWKTISEKLSNNYSTSTTQTNSKIEEIINPIESFLENEWIKSSFKSDFILVQDLTRYYNKFWRSNKVSDIMKLKIVGSNELKNFGAEFCPNFVVAFVKGISLKKISRLSNLESEDSNKYLKDIVRIPKKVILWT